MNLFAITSLSCGITCAVLAFIALIYGKTKLHRILLWFNIVVALWGIGLFLAGIANTEPEAIFGWKLGHLGGFFIAPLFYHMIYVFCGVRWRKLLYFAYSQAIFFNVINVVANRFITKTRFVFGVYYNDANIFLYLALIAYLTILISSYYELIKFVGRSKGYKRTQALYIIFGFMCGFIGGTSTFLPEFRIDILYPFGNFGITLYTLIVTYAIAKHRIINIDEVVALTITFVVICIPILAIPFILGYITKSWVLCGIVATTLAPTALYLYSRAKGRVLTERLTFQEAITEIIEVIRQVRTLDELFKILASQMLRRLKLSYVGLYLLNPGSKQFELKANEAHKALQERPNCPYTLSGKGLLVQLLLKEGTPIITEEISTRFHDMNPQALKEIDSQTELLGASLTLPVFYEENHEKELIAIAVLGERFSYRAYGDSEIKALNLLSEHIGLAIMNAQHLEKKEQRAAKNVAVGAAHQLYNALGSTVTAIHAAYLLMRDKDINKMSPDDLKTVLKLNKQQMEIALKEGEKGKAKLTSILYEAKVKKGFKRINTYELITHTIGYSSQLKSKDFLEKNTPLPTIVNKIPKDFPHIVANENLLGESLINILNNAHDAIWWRYLYLKPDKSYKGRIIVTGQDKGANITISITDNGIGMKDEVKSKIFSAYFTTKGTAGKGTGAGLFSVQGWIKAHNGYISFESEYGKGTTFTIELPKEQGGFDEPQTSHS